MGKKESTSRHITKRLNLYCGVCEYHTLHLNQPTFKERTAFTSEGQKENDTYIESSYQFVFKTISAWTNWGYRTLING